MFSNFLPIFFFPILQKEYKIEATLNVLLASLNFKFIISEWNFHSMNSSSGKKNVICMYQIFFLIYRPFYEIVMCLPHWPQLQLFGTPQGSKIKIFKK